MVFNRFKARLSKLAEDTEVESTDDLVELRWFDDNELEDVQLVPGGREFFIEAGYIRAGKE